MDSWHVGEYTGKGQMGVCRAGVAAKVKISRQLNSRLVEAGHTGQRQWMGCIGTLGKGSRPVLDME